MEEIWIYSLSQWGLAQANHYIDNLAKAFAILVDNPNIGRSCEDVRPGYLEYSVNNHVIYYHEAYHRIEIVRILHESMSVTHISKGREEWLAWIKEKFLTNGQPIGGDDD